jgi:hypothetical protein
MRAKAPRRKASGRQAPRLGELNIRRGGQVAKVIFFLVTSLYARCAVVLCSPSRINSSNSLW